MAGYKYDESGNMALFFVITVLFMVLVPVTLSARSSTPTDTASAACECGACLEKRKRLKKESGAVNFTKKGVFIALGWVVFGLLAYKVAGIASDNQIYDPFEILGIKSGSSAKEIKSHYKKLSKIYHPDKVKLTGNDTIETIANKFVELTKAYKALTDETIRKNFEDYGHPDGRQEVTMGIALPRWIVEAQNNIWVLGVYGLLFGVTLPALVGNWWFGSRKKTKDGVFAQTAANFFKSLTETSDLEEVVGVLGKADEWENIVHQGAEKEIQELEQTIEKQLGERWRNLRVLVKGQTGARDSRWDALVLLHAHLLRLPLVSPALKKAQTSILLQTPAVLNALLNVTMSRNWFQPTTAVMRLHAYLAQAAVPGDASAVYTQLPGIKAEDVKVLPEDTTGIGEFVKLLESKKDARVDDVKKAADRWGHLDLVDASFRVIGERTVTPSALVFLVVKLRLSPLKTEPSTNGAAKEAELTVGDALDDAKKDDEFLNNLKDVEDLSAPGDNLGAAHAPRWPTNRKPGWWIVLADAKSNRLVVPPLKITDVPFSHPERKRDFRSYKMKFQAPPSVGIFTWRVYLISDTFIGEDVSHDITLKIEEVAADESAADDEISEPEEDTLAGQMAAMRGGAVKKRVEESDDESSTDDDDDDAAGNDSSSDSD
ncbi:translocation protein sec63 [Artomyces pyxidatus]|uniref:Translocation protein sec63 n=1 Tax=Artomyces pyxidatus TaxID=48021 RepID=A0ACB8SPC2_9AGAM|nr:translocation protein sec63 [Artomyces pyxidatus]